MLISVKMTTLYASIFSLNYDEKFNVDWVGVMKLTIAVSFQALYLLHNAKARFIARSV